MTSAVVKVLNLMSSSKTALFKTELNYRIILKTSDEFLEKSFIFNKKILKISRKSFKGHRTSYIK